MNAIIYIIRLKENPLKVEPVGVSPISQSLDNIDIEKIGWLEFCGSVAYVSMDTCAIIQQNTEYLRKEKFDFYYKAVDEDWVYYGKIMEFFPEFEDLYYEKML